MIKIRKGTRKKLDEYLKLNGINQSFLKLLLTSSHRVLEEMEKGPDDELYYEEHPHLIVGSAVDCLLTMEKETFKELFYVSSLSSKPSATIMSIINQVYDNLINANDGKVDNFPTLWEEKQSVIDSCRSHGWNDRWGDDTVFDNIVKNGGDYYNELVDATGKQVMSQEEFLEAEKAAEIVKKSQFGWMFNEHFTMEDGDEIEVVFQYPLQGIIDRVWCKGLLDMIIVNHTKKTVSVKDFKTIGDYLVNFPIQAVKYRYDIQAAFYSTLFSQYYQSEIDDIFKGYRYTGFGFIVYSKKDGGVAQYIPTNNFMRMGMHGRREIRTNGEIVLRRVLGITDLLELYQYHETFGYEADKIIKDSNNVLTLDWNLIRR